LSALVICTTCGDGEGQALLEAWDRRPDRLKGGLVARLPPVA
jgi:predicted metal-binding protein